MTTKDWLSVAAIVLLVATVVLDVFGFRNTAMGCAGVLGLLAGHIMTGGMK